MTIESIGSSAAAAQDQLQKPDALGQDAFLKLLVTQLEHQDPTQPKADGEFLAQLAQFSSLEKLSQIEKQLNAIGDILMAFQTTDTSEDA